LLLFFAFRSIRALADALLLIELLAALVGVTSVWAVLSLLGRVRPWTGAGLRLAAFGLSAWSFSEFLLSYGGFRVGWLTPAEPAFKWVWLVRNTSLIAFGVGLGLVIAHSSIELIRRREAAGCSLISVSP